MARIRTLKPEWLEDEKLAALPDTARLLSVGLILLADDQGRGRANPVLISAHVWPYDPAGGVARVKGALEALANIQFIQLYAAAGQQYFQIRNWAKHQRVNHPGAPRLPGPEAGQPIDVSQETSNGDQTTTATPTSPTPRGAKRCPADFQLTQEHIHFAVSTGLDKYAAEREFAKFKDHTFARAITDWDATLRNWFRTARERQAQQPQPAATSRVQPPPASEVFKKWETT